MGFECVKFDNESRFLVTGGAGFIGSNLVEAILKLGYKVRVLDNFSTGKSENISEFIKYKDFELIVGDIREPSTCRKVCCDIDYILHQAAWGSVPRSIEQPLEYEENNIKGTLNMMVAARDSGVKRFVYASSSSVYGDSLQLNGDSLQLSQLSKVDNCPQKQKSDNCPRKEGQEGKLLSPYAITKKVNELYARNFYDLFGLETIGLRYFNVFGEKQDPYSHYAAVIPKFVKALINDEAPIINGDGWQSRDFTYVGNVIEANLKACIAPKEACGRIYNVACGNMEYVNDLYDKLCRLLSKDIKPNYEADRKGDIRHSQADISKARFFLEYEPSFTLEQGLERTIEWYKRKLEKNI